MGSKRLSIKDFNLPFVMQSQTEAFKDPLVAKKLKTNLEDQGDPLENCDLD